MELRGTEEKKEHVLLPPENSMTLYTPGYFSKPLWKSRTTLEKDTPGLHIGAVSLLFLQPRVVLPYWLVEKATASMCLHLSLRCSLPFSWVCQNEYTLGVSIGKISIISCCCPSNPGNLRAAGAVRGPDGSCGHMLAEIITTIMFMVASRPLLF